MTGDTAGSVPAAELVAGRYRILSEIAVGGMGRVYRVRDESTGNEVALKHLLADGGSTATMLFKREYHTLVTLRHPRIIEVYEYGVESHGPYYTMELLDGEDLRAIAPLPFDAACRYLRDVASSIALLHAHRLLHRDLSPRNVRATSDVHCKLLDFGALTPFGHPSEIVGTPASVPPEALRGMSLDQRADLYSLGVLAYFLLSGRYPYQARAMRELEGLWAARPRPPPPSEALPRRAKDLTGLASIPKTLDELVLSLVSLDPLARPASAAEVIERLNAIADLEPDFEPLAAQSYLASGPMVGRQRELERVRRMIARAVAGTGGVVTVEHASGMGGTRLLTEAAREARLNGATVLQADAHVERGPHAVARALVHHLFVALPEAALSAGSPDVQAVGWIYPPIHVRMGTKPERMDPAANPGAWRTRVHIALRELFVRVSRTHPLVIVVDGLANVDEGSVALLAVLASEGKQCPLLVIGSQRTGETTVAPTALRGLTEGGARLVLQPLTFDDTTRWMFAIFGDVPNTERLAGWLYMRSAGQPLYLSELVRHLVAQGTVRYLDGTFILPQELSADQLPERIEETLDRRLSDLSQQAHELAEAFALHRGGLPLELCVAIAERMGFQPFEVLDELTASGVLVGHGDSYQFSQVAMRDRLLAGISDEKRRPIHLLLGRSLHGLEGTDLTRTLEAGWHFYHGGEEERGAELLRHVGLELASYDELPAAVPALEAALGVYRRLERPPHELIGLLAPLTLAGYYVDRSLSKYGEEAMHLLSRHVGLEATARVRPWLGRRLGLAVGLASGLVRHCAPGRGGPRGFYDGIVTLSMLALSQAGVATICLDTQAVVRSAEVLEPLKVLGKRHPAAFSRELCVCLIGLTEERPAATIATMKELLEQLEHPRSLSWKSENDRELVKGGVLYALGALEGFQDGPAALLRAQELERTHLRLYDMLAYQLRTNYHACRGEIALAKRYERTVEIHAIRSGSAWQAEVWAPVSRIAVCLLTSDILGMKRTAEELTNLAESVPSLARYADMARGAYHFLRGAIEVAVPMLEKSVFEVEPRSFIGWTNMAATLAAAYNERQEFARARALCQSIVDEMTPEDRKIVALNLRVEIQLALSEAGLCHYEAAANRLDELLNDHAGGEGPVTLGSLHAARARVSFLHGDKAGFQFHRSQMDRWFRPTENPALISQCERLIGLSERPPSWSEASRFRPIAVETDSGHDSDTKVSLNEDTVTILDGCHGSVRRMETALRMLVEYSRAGSGYLFGLKEGDLVLLAPEHGDAPPQLLQDVVKERIAAYRGSDFELTQLIEPAHDEDGRAFQTIVLARNAGRRPQVVGAALLTRGVEGLVAPAPDFIEELATALYESGDVTAEI